MAKCCVRGCSNKLEIGSNIRMFRFPALLDKPKSLVELSRQRRSAWLIALNRTNLPEEVLKSIGICSEHFVTGSPARLKDNTEVDWIPTIKMGNQQRNRNEKKIISPSQTTTKLKRISSIEKLSELEKLKNELKCKDAIIKNYKDESVQLKDQQKKIVNNYEERLKEKDVKIKMGIRDYQIKDPHRSESHKKERGISMRSGRILHKSTSKLKLIKPCVVRIRKILKVKEEPEDEEFTPQTSVNRIVLRDRTPKEQQNKEHVSRDRSIKEALPSDQLIEEASSRNPTPISLRSRGPANARLSNSPKPSFNNKPEDPVPPKPTTSKQIEETKGSSTNKRLSNSPKPIVKKSEDPNPVKPTLKKIQDYFSPRSITKNLEEPLPIKPITRKAEEYITPKPSAKKVEESTTKPNLRKPEETVSPRLATKKVEEPLPPKPNLRKVEELRTPNSTSSNIETPKAKIPETFEAMASTRTRRAPKPNPKYLNDDIITPKLIGRREKEAIVINEAVLDESNSGDDFYYGGVIDTSDTGSNDDVSEMFEGNETSDYSEAEDFQLKRKRPQRPAPLTLRSNTPLAKRSRPQSKVSTIRPAAPTPPQTLKSIEAKKIVQVPQKLSVAQSQLLASRKRRLEEQLSQREGPESIIARNKRLNIALYDANVARPSSPARTAAPKHTLALAQTTKVLATPVSSAFASRRQMAGPLCSKVISLPSPMQDKPKVRSDSPLLQRKPLKIRSDSPLVQRKSAKVRSDSPLSIDSSPDVLDSANTQDDFETMPTFTIVNINDIINKKGDCLVQKRSDDEVQEITSPNSINRTNNRRKTGHTTILSEKIDPVKLMKPLPKTQFPPIKKTILQSSTTNQTKPQQQRISLPPSERRDLHKPIPVEKPSPPAVEKQSPNIDKPAPRILNSVVARKTFPVQPILSKFDNNLQGETNEEIAEKSVMVKENVGANKVVPSKPTQLRKLPAEKVCVQRQGNKLIKKITCFETWYVINIPEPQELIVKNCLEIPLITLSNAVKGIKLPSASWSSKVTLYRLSTQMINKPNLTPYTGEISDQSIKEEDRDKYQPSCVMFRRMTQSKSQTRMPYDRAVIFKMKTFFTNIDGKNVRLIGAPSKISSFEDIEVLLELVDELDLLHEFVETASTV